MRRAGALWAALVFATLGAPGSVTALDPNKPLSSFSRAAWQVRDGLPQDEIQTVAQTRDGYLWAGTLEGVVRFDGFAFTVFDRNNAPLPGKDAQALAESRDGTLWLGFYSGGLVAYRDGVFRSYGLAQGLPAAPMQALEEDQTGGLWIATLGAGLLRFEADRFARYTTKDGLSSDSVLSLDVDGTGRLWAGTLAGLDLFEGGRFRHFAVGDAAASSRVDALDHDGAGRLWVGTPRGLYRLGDDHVAFDEAVTRQLSNRGIRTLLGDREGALWIGTEDGLNRLYAGNVESLNVKDGLTDRVVMSLFEDLEGALWIGTVEGGLNRLRQGPVITFASQNGLSADSVDTIAPARDGGFWIGDGGEVDRFENGRFRPLHARAELGGSIILALLEGTDGALWAGNSAGLHRYMGGRWTHYTSKDGAPAGEVRALCEDRAGRLWVGTDGGGLGCLTAGAFSQLTKRDGLAGDQVRSIREGKDGTLWIATYGGLSALKNGRFTNYTTLDGLSADFARSLHLDEDGTLWIGTYGGGLNRLKDEHITAYTMRDGLFHDTLYAIVDDGLGNLWMSSTKGIFAVARKELDDFAAGTAKRIHCVAYGRGDGMASGEGNGGSPAGLRGADGRLYFATVKGMVSIDPAKAAVKPAAPPAVVEGAFVNGQALDPRRGLEIGPGMNRVELRYTSIALTTAHRLEFSYKLDGLDADWVDAGAVRQAHYTSIPAGHYLFRVRVRSLGGAWNEAGAPVAIGVRAHWYRTPAFFGMLAAAAALLAWGFYRLRVQGLVVREAELKRRVDEAVARLKVLQGLLPICAGCKKIRDDKGYWQQIESYIRQHSEAEFTHGLCPDCIQRLYPGLRPKPEA
jgi:ligand-binding sensor domain-containing protein